MNEETKNKWSGRQWIALYTQPRAEKQVAQNLTLAGIENYLPLVKERRQWSDRMKWVEVPLVNSYIFCKILDREVYKARQVSGVVCPVTFGQSEHVIARIPEQQMLDFMAFVEKAKDVKVMDAGVLRKGVAVEVVAGDFKGQRGILIREDGNNLFGIKIDGVSFAVVATIDADLLKVVDEPKPDTKTTKSKASNP